MSSQSPHIAYGHRLIPSLIDGFAKVTPFRSFCSLPCSCNPKDGFRDISYEEMAAAVNKLAWWIESRLGKSQTFESLAYIGTSDLRYAILAVAAQKTGHKVGSKGKPPYFINLNHARHSSSRHLTMSKKIHTFMRLQNAKHF